MLANLLFLDKETVIVDHSMSHLTIDMMCVHTVILSDNPFCNHQYSQSEIWSLLFTCSFMNMNKTHACLLMVNHSLHTCSTWNDELVCIKLVMYKHINCAQRWMWPILNVCTYIPFLFYCFNLYFLACTYHKSQICYDIVCYHTVCGTIFQCPHFYGFLCHSVRWTDF